jgi:hypothetical protein
MDDEYGKFRKEFIQVMVRNKRAMESQKFGDFIIQSNNIQSYLSNLVILRSSYPDKEYMDKIESGTLGQIINLFCACAKKETGEMILIPKLRKYCKIRNKFAHKIHAHEQFTKDELQNAVLLGKEVLKSLISIVGAISAEIRSAK